ncbi:MAG: hypothetical protein ACK4FB_07845 [Brevundimonas sp.]|uniref:hypothetical protein n=1 Tax=Brevundimonas sp. TaxID=1871086 RepID=UPI00391C8139
MAEQSTIEQAVERMILAAGYQHLTEANALKCALALHEAGMLVSEEPVAWRPMSECPADDSMILARRADGAMMVWRASILMHKPTPAHLDFSPTGWIACHDLNRLKGGDR